MGGYPVEPARDELPLLPGGRCHLRTPARLLSAGIAAPRAACPAPARPARLPMGGNLDTADRRASGEPGGEPGGHVDRPSTAARRRCGRAGAAGVGYAPDGSRLLCRGCLDE